MSVRRLASLLALVALSAGCAVTPMRDAAAPRGVARWYDAVDWTKAGDEAVAVLQGYIRTDTTNPPGNETRGTTYLGAVLDKEQIPYEVLESAPGRGNLVARLAATGVEEEPPLCLLSHVDVVTAEESTWTKGRGPLSGTLADGFVYGRGALDMKGLGTLELMTMVWLKRLGVPLRRSVLLVAVAGEETDSQGIQFLVDEHWGKLRCAHVVNEGGLGIEDLLAKGQTVYTISVAEKGTLWLRMTAHGEAGHGSTPVAGRAPERLVRAIERIYARDPDPFVHPSLYELAARLADDTGGVTGFVLRRPWLVRRLVVPKLMESPPARATLFDTCNVTGFEGRKEPNVVPTEVSAILDCRVLPGTRPIDLYVALRKHLDDPNVSFEILDRSEPAESTWDDPLFAALARHAVGGRPHVVAGPALSPGYTDSLYLRRKGARAYGFTPFEVPQEEMNGFHGKNERVSVANVHRGLRTLFRAVVDVAAAR